jgi:hypothetical protein
MSVGFGQNYREIDYGEEAEGEGKDQESEKRQEGRPGAEKEEVLGKEGQSEKVGREEVGPEEGKSQEGSAAEKSRAEARGCGSCAGRSGTGSLVALRVELRRWRRRQRIARRAPSKSYSLDTPSSRPQGAATTCVEIRSDPIARDVLGW